MSERLRRERISVGELEEVVHEHSVTDLSRVETAVLEMDGAISVIPKEAVAPQKAYACAREAQTLTTATFRSHH